MSTEIGDKQQQEVRNFLSLLPLTIEIAGLPAPEPGRLVTEGQMEVRATTIRNAYKVVKKLLRDIARDAALPPPPPGAPPRP